MKEIKIALTGGIRSGKTSTEKYMEEKYHMIPFAFGDKLKEYFHLENPDVPRFPKPVTGYQTYGQGKRKSEYDDIWIDLCFVQIDKIRKIAANYNIVHADICFTPLVTDLRQPNEYARLREEGYTIIRVKAPLDVRKERAKQEGDNINDKNFEAETEIHVDTFDVDYEIVNDGTLNELYEKVDNIMSVLFSETN
jgi:hypothetical protein